MRSLASLIVLAAGAPVLVTAAGADQSKIEYGRVLARECTICHNQNVASDIPRIFGLNAGAFKRAMELYRTGERRHPIMQTVAASLSPEEVDALAAYFASQPRLQ